MYFARGISFVLNTYRKHWWMLVLCSICSFAF